LDILDLVPRFHSLLLTFGRILTWAVLVHARHGLFVERDCSEALVGVAHGNMCYFGEILDAPLLDVRILAYFGLEDAVVVKILLFIDLGEQRGVGLRELGYFVIVS